MTEKAEKILYKWFEMKYRVYDKLEYDDSIYLYYMGDKYADIRIDQKRIITGVFYNNRLYEEFSQIISLDWYVFESVMRKWIEDTFNLNVTTPQKAYEFGGYILKIPK